MNDRNKCRQIFSTACAITALWLSAATGSAQTYQVNPDSSVQQVTQQPGRPQAAKPQPATPQPAKPQPANTQPVKTQPSRPQPSTPQVVTAPAAAASEQELGFGSNIQNARLAHGAEQALEQGNHALAFTYAQRAAQAAPNDAQLWFLLGYAARLDGKLGPSMDAYQRGLKLIPSSVNGMSGLAQTYAASGRTGDAERLLKQVVAADPKRRVELSILGDLSMRSGDYEGAVQWLDRAERLEPTAQSELLLAVAYEHLKQMDQANRYLELAKGRAPNNPDVQRSFAAFYRDTGDYSKAVDSLLGIRNPRPDVVAELAYTYGLAGKQEEAARTYAQAADLLPRDLTLQLSAAQAQVSIAAYDHAETFLQRAYNIDSNYYRLHSIRGTIAQVQDRNEDAAREFAAALASMPATPMEGPLYGIQLHMNLVALYQGLDQPDRAHRELATAQQQISVLDERGADRAAFLRLRAVIHLNAGELEPALSDMKETLALTPKDPNSLQIDGDLLMKLGRTPEAVSVFQQVLAIDPHSRFALTALGYAARSAGNSAEAEKYFIQLATEYPSSYVPHLALGDMYTDNHEYAKAQTSYERGYALEPQNSMIVAGGMNAAIEAHNLPLAGSWQKRVAAKMEVVPQVLREEERYFSFTGDSTRSAELGRRAIQQIPRDRQVVVYLGYDLLHLEQFDELQALTEKYMNLFPKEADIPLLSGYVYKHSGDLNRAIEGFSEALKRDPSVATAYTNRGFVYNDLHRPALAAADFEASLKLQPNNAEAHMGLAFAELNLHHPQAAIQQTQLAEAITGDNKLVHTVRATAYGREGMLTKSTQEYRSALKFDPDDGSLYLGLGNIFFVQRRYRDAIAQLQLAEQHLPSDPSVYAMMARASAELRDREETLRDIRLADEAAAKLPPTAASDNSDPESKVTVSDIYVATGQAMSTLGDEQAAMDRYGKALALPGNRVNVRLAIAQMMAKQGSTADAERQIALAQMEVDAKDALPPTGEQYVAMAGVLQQLHEYELSESYLERAKDAGAPDTSVRISLANSYLALGETRRAAAELAAVKQSDDSEVDYQYLLAEASLYQQEHRSTEALSSFAAAASDAGDDPTAERGLLDTGGSEGYRINSKISMLSNLTVQPIFEDSTVYVLDSKLNSPAGPVDPSNVAALPPPRSSVETNLINSFHLHLGGLPANSGYFQIRNARGTISVPATGSVVHRNTFDYALNFGLDPTLHLGTDVVTLHSGIQGTLRRDTLSPVEMDQNLFRVFTYASTSSFFNAVSADGYIAAEFGSYTRSPINSRQVSGAINFRVGAPWSKTALITGWNMNSQNFDSNSLGNSQNFNTASYIGLSRNFSSKLSVTAIAEFLRSWRTEPYSPIHSAIAQALRPAATIHYMPSSRWDLQASTSYESTRGFHIYDMTQNSVLLSYIRPLDRTFNETTGKVHLKYPIRFGLGVREEGFLNFSQGTTQKLVPFFSLTIF